MCPVSYVAHQNVGGPLLALGPRLGTALLVCVGGLQHQEQLRLAHPVLTVLLSWAGSVPPAGSLNDQTVSCSAGPSWPLVIAPFGHGELLSSSRGFGFASVLVSFLVLS